MRPRTIIWILFAGSLFTFCTDSPSPVEPSGLSGGQLAQSYCGSCHAYTPPDLLSKTIWAENVLPAMGHRLGIYQTSHSRDSLLELMGNRTIIEQANIFPVHPTIAMEDWVKIIDFYVEHAPDANPEITDSIPIIPELHQFTYTPVPHASRPPLTTLVKILPDGRGLVYADTKPGINKLFRLDTSFRLVEELNFKTAPIQYHEISDTLFITTIGKNPFPTDQTDGDYQIVYKSPGSEIYDQSKIILPGLQRPVSVVYGDIDQDGLEDILVCEFGNLTGQLALYRNTGGGYTRQVLKNSPGAIHAAITDWDGDGHLDIIALMSQGREGIYLFQNDGQNDPQGNISFSKKELLSFSPLHGSQYFELHDFNGDGHLDILYVCGDNADKTPILKNDHGLYIFENDGAGNLNQSWFYQQNGAYKAVAADFDQDGDLDIAAISFFPDYVNRPNESFVYLENKGGMEFVPHSFPQASQGRWMVMDVGDFDLDGDPDIVLGSFVYFIPMGDTTGLGDWWMEQGPSVVLLENNLVQRDLPK